MDASKIRDGLNIFLTGLGIDDPLFDKSLSIDCIADEWMNEFLIGYQMNPGDILTTDDYLAGPQMVMVNDISFTSFCIHHLVPIHGIVHVAYVPDKKITGLSRLGKLVECFARRLQIQERLGQQIVDSLMDYLQPLGAACYIESDQFCMIARGLKKEAKTLTVTGRGIFEEDNHFRRDFMEMVNRRK